MSSIKNTDMDFEIREIMSPDPPLEFMPGKRSSTEESILPKQRWTAPAKGSFVAIALKSAQAVVRSGERVVFEGVLPAGTSIFATSDETSLMLSGAFHLVTITLPSPITDKTPLLDGRGESHVSIIRDKLIEQLGRSLVLQDDDTEKLYSAAAVRIIACRLDRISQSRTKALPRWRLNKVRDFVERRLDGPIFLHDLACAAGLSRMHFAAQFRQSTGLRPHEYILQRRIERAKRLMLETDAQLVQIALEVGFQAQSHFTTIYKRMTGDTPGAWRRRQKRESKRDPRSTTLPKVSREQEPLALRAGRN